MILRGGSGGFFGAVLWQGHPHSRIHVYPNLRGKKGGGVGPRLGGPKLSQAQERG